MNYNGTFILLDDILTRIQNTKKIDELERYIDMYIEVYINLIREPIL